ncbi:unnamed protein product [Alternaria alternata]
MREIDAHFDAYEHLKHLPRDGEALHMLRKAASMVKPMMRKRGWKVKTLAEFLPDEPQLLGLNINRTERILIRLRYHHDSRQFLSMEQITDTLLHELSHIVFGPHDAAFNNLWNELRDEHQSLLFKGYTGEGFLSQGQKLGGRRVPLDEMRRQARIAAEKRNRTTSSNVNAKDGGHRLGGARPVQRGIDMRKVIADAASRRNSITDGCASGSANAGRLVNQQEQDGFRTTAEQDDANDWAIAQALQDLMYDEEMQRLGAPTGNGGLTWDPENGLGFDRDTPPRSQSSSLSRGGLAWSSENGLTYDDPSSTSILANQNHSTQSTSHPSPGRPLSRPVTQPPPVSRTSLSSSSRLISQHEQQQTRNKSLPPTPPRSSPPYTLLFLPPIAPSLFLSPPANLSPSLPAHEYKLAARYMGLSAMHTAQPARLPRLRSLWPGTTATAHT